MPLCDSCPPSPPFIYDVQYFYSNQCFSCGSNSCAGGVSDTDCIIYRGSNLPCSGIATNDTLTQILVKIDTQICSITGDYSTYQFNCLQDWCECTITTEAQFVDVITAYTCETRTNLDTFINTTFPAYQDAVNTRFLAIEIPGITCVSASVTDTDTIQTVLSKYCTLFGFILEDIDISDIEWSNCYTVVSPPTTIKASIIELLSQICQTKALITGSILPTFDNTSNCLEGGATDSLVTTIGLLTNAVCSSAIFNAGEISWSCLEDDLPTTLQDTIQDIINHVHDLATQSVTSWSGDFIVSATNPENPCAGVTIALATPINSDRFVASNADDASPGTLIDKLEEGDNITLDAVSDPGRVIINAAGSDHLVISDPGTGSDTPGTLIDKLLGSSANGITITPVYDAGSGKIILQLSVDEGFCEAVNACIPSLCRKYSITNSTGDAVEVSYDASCDETTDIVTIPTFPDGARIEVCAKIDSISAPGCVITLIGAC